MEQASGKEYGDSWIGRGRNWLQDPIIQARIVVVIVCVALLLDNMLYMVIVPIMPYYLRQTNTWGILNISGPYWNSTADDEIIYVGEDATLGFLFAIKAIVQLLCNPITGTVTDRIGYEKPMLIGLIIIFFSTLFFAFGESLALMFIARGVQGCGSAFADTAGFAMIADRFPDGAARNRALGVALAFISFGCLFAPPFGGTLFALAGKELPFIILAFIAFFDAIAVFGIMRTQSARKAQPVGAATPMHRLLLDPCIAVIAGALAVSNVSLAFIEPTIANWMHDSMNATKFEVGIVWFPGFIPHIFGVYLCVRLANRFPRSQWMYGLIGVVIIGASNCVIPACKMFAVLMLPICGICFGIAMVDTALIPALSYLMDVRYVSVYGSVYAIADISYSIAYALGPIIAGSIVSKIGFMWMNEIIGVTAILYAPVLLVLKKIYDLQAKELEKQLLLDEEEDGNLGYGVTDPSRRSTTTDSYEMLPSSGVANGVISVQSLASGSTNRYN